MTAQPIPEANDPKSRILDAAERLFVAQGVAGTSLRSINAAAGMNPAAVHYHFGTKETLLLEVMRRRVNPVNKQRLERLDALEAAAGDAPLSVEAILSTFLAPAVKGDFSEIVAVLHHESKELAARIAPLLFGAIAQRFTAALGKSLPALPPDELILRFKFTVGLMLHTMRGFADFSLDPAQPSSIVPDPDIRLRQLVAFAAAGFRTPPSTASLEETSHEI